MASVEKRPPAASSKYFQFNLNTSAITDKALEYLNPEKVTEFLEEHKSGFIVATLWGSFILRSWLSNLSILSLSTLPLTLLALLSLTLTTPSRSLFGLSYYAYTEVSSSISSLSNKELPTWLPRAIPIVLLFPVTRAAMLLLLLAVWEVVSKYRNGVARVTEAADDAVRRAVETAEKATGYLRDAKVLELQAMQWAAKVVHDEKLKATALAIVEVKSEVEGLAKEMLGLGATVEKVRKQARRVKTVAEEGDLELAGDMVVNVEKFVDRVVRGEKNIEEKVEGMRGKFWNLSLGRGFA